MNKNIFFTSDWHIGHESVIEYSKRPFLDCPHMHRVLINNYNATVTDGATCYFLGDIGMAKDGSIERVISKLRNSYKILILGNHDTKSKHFWSKAGFAAVLHSASFLVGKHTVTMSHCPLPGLYREDTRGMRGGNLENWHGESKHQKKGFTVHNFGQYHLHGHIHSPNQGKSKKILGKQFDVGVDGNNYTPVSISNIESWIAKNQKEGEI